MKKRTARNPVAEPELAAIISHAGSMMVAELPMVLQIRFLLHWAKAHRARLAVIGSLLSCDTRSQAEIARAMRVTDSLIHRAIKDGRSFLSSKVAISELEIILNHIKSQLK
jgi:hypothetical protein